MTTIVFRDGILASDTRAFSGHSTPIGDKQKIFQHERSGALIGISTNTPGLGEQVAAWFLDDKNPDLAPGLGPNDGLDAIEIDVDGNVFVYNDSLNPTGPLDAPFFAVGSGANYALGAMIMGATAAQGVETAMRCDPWTGGKLILAQHPEWDDAVSDNPEPAKED